MPTIEKTKLVHLTVQDTGVITEVMAELAKASTKYPPYPSPEHGLAVIDKQYRQLQRAVDNSNPDARRQAIQVASTAIRFVLDLDSVVHGFTEASLKRAFETVFGKEAGSVEPYEFPLGNHASRLKPTE